MPLKLGFFQYLNSVNNNLRSCPFKSKALQTRILIQGRNFSSNYNRLICSTRKEAPVLKHSYSSAVANCFISSHRDNCSSKRSITIFTMGRKSHSKNSSNAKFSGTSANNSEKDPSTNESPKRKGGREQTDKPALHEPSGSSEPRGSQSITREIDAGTSKTSGSQGLTHSNPGVKGNTTATLSSGSGDLPRSLSETGAVAKSAANDSKKQGESTAKADGTSTFSSKSSPSGEPPLTKTTSERGAQYNQKFTSFEEDWNRIKALSLEKKRSIYKCRSYFPLDHIPSWTDYAKKENYFILKSIKKFDKPPGSRNKYAVDAELNSKVSLFVGDITALEIDCIVNAANSSLLGGGGVDGAIHRAAGPSLVKECKTLGGCSTGEAKITYGYKLPAKHVIHTVGPMTADEDDLLSCYRNSLNIALEKKLRSLAFPCIATGVYGFPNDVAAQLVIPLVREVLSKGDNKENFDRIIFCLFLQRDIDLYHYYMKQVFPVE